MYVRPFPSGEGKWQISVNGGSETAWRGDGKELFYVAANQDLMAVTVKTGSIVDAGPPTRLFATAMSSGLINPGYTRNQYAVVADGQRFLINQGTATASPTLPVTVVVNWTGGVEEMIPCGAPSCFPGGWSGQRAIADRQHRWRRDGFLRRGRR